MSRPACHACRPTRLRARGVAAWLAAAAWLLVSAPPAAAHPAPPQPVTPGSGRPSSTALDALTDPDAPAWSRRQVVLHPDRLEFRQAGASLGSLRFFGLDASLPEIAELLARIDREGWVRHLGGGVYLLRAALVQAPGTSLTISAPAVREVRLARAYLAGTGAHATLRDVTVTSWDASAGEPERTPRDGRPFVLYGEGSTLDVAGSELAYLGSARAKGESGVTWSQAAGRISDSVFHHNHRGITLDRSGPVEITGSAFRDSAVHGLAAAGPSRGLTVTGSRAADNGGHGFLVRNRAYGVTLRGNRATGNASHGILLDQGADQAVLDGNHAEGNDEDGLVLRSVAHATVSGNTLRANRVGVRVAERSHGMLLERNRVSGNEVGVELYGGTRGTRLVGNRVTGSGRVGLLLEATGTRSHGDRVRGGPVGVAVRDRATLEGTSVAGAERGVVVAQDGAARLRDVTVEAGEIAVRARLGGRAQVRDSTLEAPVPLRGAAPAGLSGNTLRPVQQPPPPPPAPPPFTTTWLALAGVGCVCSAVALQLLHRIRNRGERPRHAPGH